LKENCKSVKDACIVEKICCLKVYYKDILKV